MDVTIFDRPANAVCSGRYPYRPISGSAPRLAWVRVDKAGATVRLDDQIHDEAWVQIRLPAELLRQMAAALDAPAGEAEMCDPDE